MIEPYDMVSVKMCAIIIIIATVPESAVTESALRIRSELIGGIVAAALSSVAAAAIVLLIIFSLYRRYYHTTKMLPNNADP